MIFAFCVGPPCVWVLQVSHTCYRSEAVETVITQCSLRINVRTKWICLYRGQLTFLFEDMKRAATSDHYPILYLIRSYKLQSSPLGCTRSLWSSSDRVSAHGKGPFQSSLVSGFDDYVTSRHCHPSLTLKCTSQCDLGSSDILSWEKQCQNCLHRNKYPETLKLLWARPGPI